MLSGTGHAKLILFGEHAAVHGHPALGVSLWWETRVEFLPSGEWTFPGLDAADAATLGRLVGWIAPGETRGVVRVSSTVPRGVGFGSSAALCVALAAALDGSVPPYGRTVWERAHHAEGLFHGRPSGVDTGLALLDGFRSFRPSPPGLPRERPLPPTPLALVVGATPRLMSTARLVADLGARIEGGEAGAARAVEALGAIAVEAESAFLDGSMTAILVGVLADRAQRHLAELGLSTPAADRMLSRGRELGCLGGKLSGGGGGGAFYVVCGDPEHAREVAAGMQLVAAELGLPERGFLHPLILP